MTCFISGGAKNGKSTLAQNLAVTLSRNGPRYYVATMIPVDAEDRARIRRHVADRAGLGVESIECGGGIRPGRNRGGGTGSCLVDSATALLQNALFPPEKNYEMDLEAAGRCADELIAFVRSVGNAVVVSDYLYSDAVYYDPSTEAYRRCLAEIDRRLAQVCDTVVEMSAGIPILYKGAMPL